MMHFGIELSIMSILMFYPFIFHPLHSSSMANGHISPDNTLISQHTVRLMTGRTSSTEMTVFCCCCKQFQCYSHFYTPQFHLIMSSTMNCRVTVSCNYALMFYGRREVFLQCSVQTEHQALYYVAHCSCSQSDISSLAHHDQPQINI